jgi:hypothetical protein
MGIANLTPAKAKKGPMCEVCIALDRLDAKEAAALRGHLANPQWRYTALADALRDEGVDLPAFTLARHARGGCGAREKLRGA